MRPPAVGSSVEVEKFAGSYYMATVQQVRPLPFQHRRLKQSVLPVSFASGSFSTRRAAPTVSPLLRVRRGRSSPSR